LPERNSAPLPLQVSACLPTGPHAGALELQTWNQFL